MVNWRPAEIDKARALWADNLSAQAIAERLGFVTRRDVITLAVRERFVRGLIQTPVKKVTWDWTPENIEEARKLWERGDTAAHIAKQLGHGLTRNAICSIAFRKGFTRRTAKDGSYGRRPDRQTITLVRSVRSGERFTHQEGGKFYG